ncbi:MAG: D-alanine--D-alanine ligase, partial [Deltaproteobacteria bacterium]
ARTKALLRAAGLPVAEDRVLRRGEPVDWDALADALGLPVVLKTEASGSSVGVDVVRDRATLAARGAELLRDTPALLAEAYLSGREFTGPVLEDADGTPRALPAVEIRPRTAAFFDYVAKYTPGATDELCPAPIPAELEARIGDLALAAHRALGCRGYSRTDIMLDGAGAPRVLEVNTLPGLTRESLLPKSARVAGLSFPELVARLLQRTRDDAGAA